MRLYGTFHLYREQQRSSIELTVRTHLSNLPATVFRSFRALLSKSWHAILQTVLARSFDDIASVTSLCFVEQTCWYMKPFFPLADSST